MAGSLYASLHRRFGTPRPARAAAQYARAQQRALRAAGLLPESFRELAFDAPAGLRVGVVGAGFAGLTAGWSLALAGCAVTVHEAGDQVGGRVRTDRTFVPGKIVEAGAELIGTNHPMWWALAEELGLGLTPISTEKDYARRGLAVRLRLDGHDLDDAEQEALYRDLTAVFDVLGEEARPVDPAAPWAVPGAAALDAQSVADRLDPLAPGGTRLPAALDLLIDNDNCSPMAEQSYLGLLALISAGRVGEDMRGYWEATETHRCAQGNQALAERLAQRLGDAVRTDEPVTGLTVVADGVVLTTAGGPRTYAHVVLATPPSTWAAIDVDPPFDPADYAMTHGPAVKYLTRFPTAFWTGRGLAPSARSDRVGSIWESTDRQAGRAGFGLTAYSGGSYVLPDAATYAARLAELYAEPPAQARLVDWPSTEWILTGNSVPAMGEVTTVAPRLTAPYRGRIWFAGEQTSIGFFGYMEGALRSGARVARDLLAAQGRVDAADRVPAAPPAGLRVLAPLGLPATASPTDQRARAEELRDRLTLDPAPFAGDRVTLRWELRPGGAVDPVREVVAMWPGYPRHEADGMLTLQLDVRHAGELRDMVGTPTPTVVTYGPVEALPAGGLPDLLGAGEPVGRLAGDELVLGFQDDFGYHLEPVAVLQRLGEAGVLGGSGGAPCPLLPAGTPRRPQDVAGPDPVAPGRPHLVLRSGTDGPAVHNPPDPLPTSHFSFLAAQQIHVVLANAPGPGPHGLQIEDVSSLMYHTDAGNPITPDLSGPAGYRFVPRTDLPPWGTTDGSLLQGEPLAYRLDVAPAGEPDLVSTTVGQSLRDVVRQEYESYGVPVPAADALEPAHPPAVARHFTLAQFVDDNNFGADPDAVLLHASEMFQVAEYLRRQYAYRLAEVRRDAPDTLPRLVASADLSVNSSWRNPQRNKAVGGVRLSNHQFGRALDLTPVHAPKRTVDAAGRSVLVLLLFEAARDFGEQLAAINGPDAVADLEIFVEKGPKMLWRYRLRPDGTFVAEKGSRFDEVVTPPGVAPESAATAGSYASHVHVAWKSSDPDQPLVLPAVPSDDVVPPNPAAQYRNVVLIGVDDDGVPADGRLPFDHAAASLEAALRAVDPLVTPLVREAGTAVDFLQFLDALREDAEFEIRYLVVLAHGRRGALELTHFADGATEDERHDPAVHEMLNELYDAHDFDFSTETDLPLGADDATTVATGDVRVANLRYLPAQVRDRMRRTFAGVRDVVVLAAGDASEGGAGPSFAQELADLLDRPVLAALGPVEVLAPDPDGTWRRRPDLVAGGPTPTEQPVVVVPADAGALEYLESLRTEDGATGDPDLLGLYRHLLTRFDPREQP